MSTLLLLPPDLRAAPAPAPPAALLCSTSTAELPSQLSAQALMLRSSLRRGKTCQPPVLLLLLLLLPKELRPLKRAKPREPPTAALEPQALAASRVRGQLLLLLAAERAA